MPSDDEQMSSAVNHGDKSSTPPPPPSPSPFHPAFAVSNIRNIMPVVLDNEEGQYETWAELFQIHATAFNVLDHIDASVPRPTDINISTWRRHDVIVKQWIYGTITKDLVQTIIKQGASVRELWTRLEEIFHDNKHTRAVYLEEKISTIKLKDYANMAEHCKQLKLLADQLANVDRPVSDQSLVLQLIKGLPKGKYNTLVVMIQQANPIPSFNKVRSQFLLEETRKEKQEDILDHALMAQSATTTPPTTASPPAQSRQQAGGGRGGGKGRGKTNGKGGKGRGNGKDKKSNSNSNAG